MKFSCFPFENYLGVLRRAVRSGVKVAQQLAKRLAERDSVAAESVLETGPPSPLSLSPSGYDEQGQEYSALACEAYTLKPKSSRDSFFYDGR